MQDFLGTIFKGFVAVLFAGWCTFVAGAAMKYITVWAYEVLTAGLFTLP